MALKAVGRDQALHITRVLGSTGEHLPGGQLSAGQGSHRVGLPSLADVEAFLVPLTAEEILSAGMGGRLNYLEPATSETLIWRTLSTCWSPAIARSVFSCLR
jgi:hypothetical protein